MARGPKSHAEKKAQGEAQKGGSQPSSNALQKKSWGNTFKWMKNRVSPLLRYNTKKSVNES